MSNLAVLGALPLVPGLFDLAVIDEASQCDIAQQYELTNAAVQRFTYRVNSAFDLADTNPSVPDAARVRLDIHFRSHDLIADYCNEAFYEKTLHVETVTERLNIPRDPQFCLSFCYESFRTPRTAAIRAYLVLSCASYASLQLPTNLELVRSVPHRAAPEVFGPLNAKVPKSFR